MLISQIEPEDLLKAFREIVKEELQLMNEARKIKTYTIKEAAKALSISVSTFNRMRDSGEIKASPLRGKKVFTEEVIQKALNNPRW